MSDAKPVFSISPIVLQPAIVPVPSQRREVQSNMYGRDLRTFWHKAILQGGPKIRIFDHSSLYVPYISATAKNRGLQAAYVAFCETL